MPSLSSTRLNNAWRPAMPISDNYVVQFLLQGTRSSAGSIVWQETDDGYVTCLNGVRVLFDTIVTRTGSRYLLTFCCAAGTCTGANVQVVEPVNIGLFRAKYEDEDERRLAELLQELSVAISQQSSARKRSGVQGADSVREALYRRLLDSHSSET